MIKLTNFDPDAMYDADELSVELNIHRTTVHKTIFSNVPTRTIGRRKVAMGANVIRYLKGEQTDAPAQA